MQVRIYRPAKTVMQSGYGGNAKRWVLEYEPRSPQVPDHLMGWLGSDDTNRQLHLSFATKEEAIAYAEREGVSYRVVADPKRIFRPKSYADNFRPDKMEFGRF